MENAKYIKIYRSHRLGRFNVNITRPIVAKFNFHQDKLNAKQRSYTEFRDSTYRVAEQYPREIKDLRQILHPVIMKAKQLDKKAVMS